jgi:hypothetical protein
MRKLLLAALVFAAFALPLRAQECQTNCQAVTVEDGINYPDMSLVAGINYPDAMILFGASSSFPMPGAPTGVTGTVTDPNGIPYAGATLKVSLTPTTSGQLFWTGGSQAQCVAAGAGSAPCNIPFTPPNAPIELDSTGSFQTSLYPNGQISPAGTQWQFQININSPGPLGPGAVTFTVPITIVGANQSVSVTLTAAAPSLLSFSIVSGSIPFSGITSGTNTTAAMVVGTGASLAATGTGSISATTCCAVAGVLSLTTSAFPQTLFTYSNPIPAPAGLFSLTADGTDFKFENKWGVNLESRLLFGSTGTVSLVYNAFGNQLNFESGDISLLSGTSTLGTGSLPFGDIYLGVGAAGLFHFTHPSVVGLFTVTIPSAPTTTVQALAPNPANCVDGITIAADATGGVLSTTPCSSLPALPTTPNGVAQNLASTPAGGVGQPAAWTLPGIATRAITGATAADTILVTDCSQRVDYQGTVNVAVTLPTATTFGVANCSLYLANDPASGSTTITVTPTTWTFYGSLASIAIASGQACIITVDPAGSVWDYHCNGGSVSFPLLAPNGTAAAPSYSFSGATNYGMSIDTHSVLGLFGNGNLGFEVDSNGYAHVTDLVEFEPIGAASSCYLDQFGGALLLQTNNNPCPLGLYSTISIYNGVNTAGNGVPAIYGYVSCTQATPCANAATTIYTVGASDSQIAIHANTSCTTTVAGATAILTITYVDPSGTTQTITEPTATCTALGASSVASVTTTVRGQAASVVQYKVTIANAPHYETSVAVELEGN